MRSALHLVPRTRSSRRPSGKCDRELRVQRGTRIIKLLVVLRFRSSHLNVPRVLANFGIGPLASRYGDGSKARDIQGDFMIELTQQGDIAILKLVHGKANALDLELCDAIAARLRPIE